MQLPFAICLEASCYAMSELGLPNAGSHYAKLTAQGFFTWGEMPLKTCVNSYFLKVELLDVCLSYLARSRRI